MIVAAISLCTSIQMVDTIIMVDGYNYVMSKH